MARKHELEFYETSAMNNTGIDDAMNGLARQMCLKWDSLTGSFAAGFSNSNIVTPRLEPAGFKLDSSGGGGGIGCCTSRGDGLGGKKD